MRITLFCGMLFLAGIAQAKERWGIVSSASSSTSCQLALDTAIDQARQTCSQMGAGITIYEDYATEITYSARQQQNICRAFVSATCIKK